MDTVRTSYTCSCDTLYEAYEHKDTVTRVRTEGLGDKFVAVLPGTTNEEHTFKITTEGLVVDINDWARGAIRTWTAVRYPTTFGGSSLEIYCKEESTGEETAAPPEGTGSEAGNINLHGHVDVAVTLRAYWDRYYNTPGGIDRSLLSPEGHIHSRTEFVKTKWKLDPTSKDEKQGCDLVVNSREVSRPPGEVDDTTGVAKVLVSIADSMAEDKIKQRHMFFRDKILPAECRLQPDKYAKK